MSKTKLMKIGPARSHFRCRDRGKLSGKNGIRSGAVKKPPKVKAESRPVSKRILRKELLNPAQETMTPITYEDFVKMGRYSLHPDVDYKLCKYHDGLVRSGAVVTPGLLKAKAIELFENAGIPVNEFKRSCLWIQAFMVRCGRFRAAKLRGIATDSVSLKRFDAVYSEELRKMEPVCTATKSKEAKACTCSGSRPTTQSVDETASPLVTLFASTPSEPLSDTQETSLLNLFSTPADKASTNSPSKNRSKRARDERDLCIYCMRRKRKQKEGPSFIGYDFQDHSFPELLPSSPTKNGHKQTALDSYSFYDTEFSDCGDSAASELFDIAKSLS